MMRHDERCIFLIGNHHLLHHKYPNYNSFNEKGFQDVEFLKNKLMKFYGEPQLKIEKPEFRAYKWENNEVTIILNSLRNELMTSLNYIVNSR